MGKESRPSQEASAIPAQRELKEPHVRAGSHKADTCLQNKHRKEDAPSAETSRGCDRLGRGWEADLGPPPGMLRAQQGGTDWMR